MKNTDYLKRPELVMNEIPVKLSEKEMGCYQIMKRELVVSLKDAEIDAANAAALSSKLLQMANGAVYDLLWFGKPLCPWDRLKHHIYNDLPAGLLEQSGRPVNKPLTYWRRLRLRKN